MIDTALLYLRRVLDDHLAGAVDVGAEERVVLLDGDKLDPPTFRLGAVIMLIVNIQQENALRAGDLHRRPGPGTMLAVTPQVRLDVFLLLVARFKAYETSWAALSSVLRSQRQAPRRSACLVPRTAHPG